MGWDMIDIIEKNKINKNDTIESITDDVAINIYNEFEFEKKLFLY